MASGPHGPEAIIVERPPLRCDAVAIAAPKLSTGPVNEKLQFLLHWISWERNWSFFGSAGLRCRSWNGAQAPMRRWSVLRQSHRR